MKQLNLLNRCMLTFYSYIAATLRICGISSCYFNRKYKIFISNSCMRAYTICTTTINVMILLSITMITVKQRFATDTHVIRFVVKLSISFFARFHQTTYEDDFIELLNELYQLLEDMRVLARHPNFFRLTHLALLVLAIQSLIRSILIFPLSHGAQFVLFEFILHWLFILAMLTFNLLVTAVLMIFILIIACYDELQRCTKRISADVRILRLSQQMDSGQRLVLVRQLGNLLAQLIALRRRMFSVTRQFIKFFRLHLVLSILYWIGHEAVYFLLYDRQFEKEIFWEIFIGLLNIAFYCSIFEIFMWKSQLSRSFWNFHLTNYDAEFDRTVDQLLHCELVEHVKVAAYGIPLNMSLFCKVLLLTMAYFLMRCQYRKI